MTKPDRFSLQRIRDAFYATFTGAGELWFPSANGRSGASPEEERAAVDRRWQEFEELLQDVDKGIPHDPA